MAVALPLLALAVWWAVHRGVRRCAGSGARWPGASPQALQPVRSDGAPSEMAPMVDALNGLFERIGALMESERRFTADAAHELRTPIAAIRAQAQVALAEADDALRRHALQATLQGCDRAARLVDQLLTLSRLEAAARRRWPRWTCARWCQAWSAELAPQGAGKQQALELDAAASLPRAGEPRCWRCWCATWSTTRMRYSPAGGQRAVARAGHAEGASLGVEDSGPGLAEADLQRLGERFFRVVGSGQSGSGLGWSIVRRIAQVHRAQPGPVVRHGSAAWPWRSSGRRRLDFVQDQKRVLKPTAKPSGSS